jgi:hypothetical protein
LKKKAMKGMHATSLGNFTDADVRNFLWYHHPLSYGAQYLKGNNRAVGKLGFGSQGADRKGKTWKMLPIE